MVEKLEGLSAKDRQLWEQKYQDRLTGRTPEEIERLWRDSRFVKKFQNTPEYKWMATLPEDERDELYNKGIKQLEDIGIDVIKEEVVKIEKLDNFKVYTDKFDIVKNKNELDIGITLGEFGVGETGSICVDNYAYEARIASMLPLINIIFMPKNYIVNNMQDAFDVLAKVFWKGYSGFVTGPSRTSDIERVLTLGVHGPSRVILFAIEDDKR